MSLLAPALLGWLLLLPLMIALIFAGRRRKTVRVGSVMLFKSLQGGEASRLKTFRSLSRLQVGLLSVFVVCGVFHAAGLRVGKDSEVVTWHVYLEDSVRMTATTPGGQTLASRAVEALRLWARRAQAGSQVVVHRLSATASEMTEAVDVRRLGYMDQTRCEEFLFAPDSFRTLARTPAPVDFPHSLYVGTSPEHGRRAAHAVLIGGVDNVAVTVFEAKAAGGSNALEYFAVVGNMSGRPQGVQWRLADGGEGAPIASGSVQISSSAEVEVAGTCPAPEGNLVFSIVAESDGYPLDDVATLLPSAMPLAAVRHGDGDAPTAQLLRKAVEACGWSVAEAVGGETPAICFAVGGGLADGIPTFLVLPTVVEGMRASRETVAGAVRYSPDAEDRWRRLQLDKLDAVTLQKTVLPSVWHPILQTEDGTPAMATDGTHVLLFFDPARSGWATKASFPLAVAEFLRSATGVQGWRPLLYDAESRVDSSVDRSCLSRRGSVFVGDGYSTLPEVSQESRAVLDGAPVELLLWLSLAGILLNYGVFAGRGATASRERRM